MLTAQSAQNSPAVQEYRLSPLKKEDVLPEPLVMAGVKGEM